MTCGSTWVAWVTDGLGFFKTLWIAFWYAFYDIEGSLGVIGVGASRIGRAGATGRGVGALITTGAATFLILLAARDWVFFFMDLSKTAYSLALALLIFIFFANDSLSLADFSASSFSFLALSLAYYSSCSFLIKSFWNSSSAIVFSTNLSLFWTMAVIEPNPSKSSLGSSFSSCSFYTFIAAFPWTKDCAVFFLFSFIPASYFTGAASIFCILASISSSTVGGAVPVSAAY